MGRVTESFGWDRAAAATADVYTQALLRRGHGSRALRRPPLP